MRYYKMCSDGYIIAIGIGGKQGETISASEYEEIRQALSNIPQKDGYYYKIKINLLYEEFELEEIIIEPSDNEYTEAGKILLGVSE